MSKSSKNVRSKAFYSKIGRKGGQAVVARYGNEYMQVLGILGADATNQHLSKTALLRTQRMQRRIIREA